MGKMSKYNTPKNGKIVMKFAQKGALLQCGNNRYTKFECKRMKTFVVTD